MDDQRGILEPEQARQHFTLTRAQPAEDLAHLIERHWMVEWDLSEPFTQEIVTHPSVNIAFQEPPTIHGVYTGRFRQELTGSGRVIATKFRPGGFHAFHPVPAVTLTDQVILATNLLVTTAFSMFARTGVIVSRRRGSMLWTMVRTPAAAVGWSVRNSSVVAVISGDR